MGAWGTAIFSDDLAADVRGDWRDLLLDGAQTDAAATSVIESHKHAIEDPDESVVFWLALAAAQMETGRLQPSVRDKALAIIEAGGDVARWEAEDPSAARQREKVLSRLAEKLRGPQPKPKKLRRRTPLGVAFDLGDVVRVRAANGEREALAIVVDEAEGYPRGTTNPVVELLAWSGGEIPATKDLARMPVLMTLDDLPGMESKLRPRLWAIFTGRRDQVFGPHVGEVVARGVAREPSGDHRRADAFTSVGASACSWTALQAYIGGPRFPEDLRLTLEQSSKRRPPRSRR